MASSFWVINVINSEPGCLGLSKVVTPTRWHSSGAYEQGSKRQEVQSGVQVAHSDISRDVVAKE